MRLHNNPTELHVKQKQYGQCRGGNVNVKRDSGMQRFPCLRPPRPAASESCKRQCVHCQPRTEPQPRAMTLRPVYLSICLSASLVVWLSFVWSVCSVCFLRVHMCSKPSAVTHSSSRPQRQRASWQSSWSADFDAMSLLIIIYSTGLTLTASLCSVPLQVKAAITKILLKLNLTVSVWIT